MGLRDARHLDLLVNGFSGYPPRESATVLDELVELERRGLVQRHPVSAGGSGYRWSITEVGLSCLQD
jgi:DNA-binding HxlR family transcriptional regulator